MSVSAKEFSRLEWELLKKLSTTKFVRATSCGLCSSIVSAEVCFKFTGVPFSRLLEIGAVYVQGQKDLKPQRILDDQNVVDGDLIRIHPYPRRYKTIDDIDWKKTLIHDSDDYVIINKPAGIPSQPTLDNYYENIFVAASTKVNTQEGLYLPHRLDTDTSGLILLSKTKRFASYFGNLLRTRQNVSKKYRAIIASSSAESIAKMYSQINTIKPVHHATDNLTTINDNHNQGDGILITNYIEKSSRTPKVFTEFESENSLLCQLLLASNSKPVTRSIYDWKKWSKELSTDKYDEVLIDNFRKGFSFWLDVKKERPPFISNSLLGHPDMPLFPVESDVDSEEGGEGDDKNTSLTLWDVDIQLLTGRTHQCRGQLQALGDGMHIAGDNMYTGATTANRPDGYQSSAFLALQAYQLSFQVILPMHRTSHTSPTSPTSPAPEYESPLSTSSPPSSPPPYPPPYPSKHQKSEYQKSIVKDETRGNPPLDETSPTYSPRHTSVVSYELEASWWQPLSDHLRELSKDK